jgi:selenocysteine lyase/cysteine desulfurase
MKGLLGPQGTGGLYIGESVNLDTIKEGGTGSESANSRQPEMLPDRYESGTLNTPGIAGLNEGLKYILEREVEQIRHYEQALTEYLLEELGQIRGVHIYGPRNPRNQVGVISFNIERQDCEWVAAELDREFQIACRAGLHCAYLAHRTQGTEKTGTVRFSIGPFVSKDEIGAALAAIRVLAQRACRT